MKIDKWEAKDIGNYYGGLEIINKNNKYYWGILNYDGIYLTEIPKQVFDVLIKNKLLEKIDVGEYSDDADY